VDHRQMPWNIWRHDSQIDRGLYEMQRASDNVKDSGNYQADSLCRGQSFQEGHG